MRSLPALVSVTAAFALLAAGCSSGARRAEQVDPLLAQAGFRATPADSTARHEALSAVEPLKIQYFSYKGSLRFWFADPYVCHCVYSGNESNYRLFRQLKREHAEALDEETEQQKFLEFETLPANQVFYAD